MKLSIRTLIIVSFILVFVPALAMLSIADYRKASSALKDNFHFMTAQTAENVIGAYDLVEVGYQILSLSMENKMLAAFEPFKEAYYNANGVVDKIDLVALKNELGEEFDLYIINENGVIIHTTFEKDFGLDFSKVAPEFNEQLQKIRIESRYQGDRIAGETVTGNVRKYAYWGTPDKKYILEIGIKSSQFELPLKNLDLLKIATRFEDFNPALNSVLIFNSNGKILNQPDFEPQTYQIERVRQVYGSGMTEQYFDEKNNTRTLYVKADVDDQLGSASQGDRVIELVFDTSEVNSQLRSLAENQIVITIIFLFVGGIFSIFFARTISRPILLLNNAVKNIAAGDLKSDVPKLSSSKEVEALQNGIQQMKDNIKNQISEIQTLNSSYERFVPKQFLTLLEKESIIEVKLGDSTRLNMAVLFSDMRNFTSISEKMSPEQNFSFLNQYLSKVTPSINENSGFIDKYIGDAIMALFSNGPDDAVKASIEMIKQLRSWGEDSSSAHPVGLDMGIGIHVGNLILGTIGETDRMETTVISDTVNVSARLESLCKNYGTNIIISKAVYDALDSKLKQFCRLIDKTRVKGKTEEIEIYEVFAADTSEIIKSKKKTVNALNNLITAYYANELKTAKSILVELSENNENDSVFLEWSKRF